MKDWLAVDSSTNFMYHQDYPLNTQQKILGITYIRSVAVNAANGGKDCVDKTGDKLDSSMFALGGDSALFHPFSLDDFQPSVLSACPSIPMTMITMQKYYNGVDTPVGMNTWRRQNLFTSVLNSVISAWPMKTNNSGSTSNFAVDGFKVTFEPVSVIDTGGIVNLYRIAIYQSSDTLYANPQYIGVGNQPGSSGVSRLERATSKEKSAIFVIVPVRASDNINVIKNSYYLRVCTNNCIDTPRSLFVCSHGGEYDFSGKVITPTLNWTNRDYGFLVDDMAKIQKPEVVWNIVRPGECGEP
jgi:hypothetical protein